MTTSQTHHQLILLPPPPPRHQSLRVKVVVGKGVKAAGESRSVPNATYPSVPSNALHNTFTKCWNVDSSLKLPPSHQS